MSYIKSLAQRIFSPGECAALRHLFTELAISRHHRAGLRKVRRLAWSRPAKLNLGSGDSPKTAFLNVDLFPGGDLTLDLRRPLPFESDCCSLIFSEHFFEHIDYPSPVTGLFQECFRILRPGAVLRFSVPDTEWPLQDYAQGPNAPYFKACRDNPWWHPADCSTRLEHINYHFRQRDQHRFAYDFETAQKLLAPIGFQVSRAAFDPALDSARRQLGSLFIAAQKP